MTITAINNGSKSVNQEHSQLDTKNCVAYIEDGICFKECYRCGWVGVESTPSKHDYYDIVEMKRYSDPKCPYCD